MASGMEELEEEMELLKDQIDSLQEELENVKDERDTMVGNLEMQMEKSKMDMEAGFKKKLKAADAEAEERLYIMGLEVDRMRSAFSGDASGWVEKVSKNGQVYYENSETNEIKDTEPESLYIAKAMQRVQLCDEYAEQVKTLTAQT